MKSRMENDRCWLPLQVRPHDESRDTSWDDDSDLYLVTAIEQIREMREVFEADEAEWNKREDK